MDASKCLIERGRALLRPVQLNSPHIAASNEWRDALQRLMLTSLNAPPQYETLRVFLEFAHEEPLIVNIVYRTGMFHVLRAWVLATGASKRRTLEQLEFIDSVVFVAQQRPEIFDAFPGLLSLFLESVLVFADQATTDSESEGFASIMLLNYAWPSALAVISKNFATAVHAGSHVGLWLVRALVPDDQMNQKFREGSTFPLICGSFPRNGIRWHESNIKVAKRLVRPALLRHLVLTTRRTVPSMASICNSVLERMWAYDSIVKSRIEDFFDYIDSPATNALSQYWSDELR